MFLAPFIACILFATVVYGYWLEAGEEEYKKDIKDASDENWSCGWFDD
tara:strand:- start:63 stop:206 length:144 start_codon:yes stop_codon:yes gene_type:complete